MPSNLVQKKGGRAIQPNLQALTLLLLSTTEGITTLEDKEINMRWKREKLDKEKWHKYFAWFPVQIRDTDEMVWLETVERRFVMAAYDWYYEYRLLA